MKERKKVDSKAHRDDWLGVQALKRESQVSKQLRGKLTLAWFNETIHILHLTSIQSQWVLSFFIS